MSFSVSQVLVLLVCAAVTMAAWAYGGTETWAILTVSFLTLGALLVYGWGGFRRRNREASTAFPPLGGTTTVWVVATLGLVLLLVVQLVNPSHDYSALDQGLTVRSHVEWLPATVSVSATARALMILLTCVATYWLAARGIRGRDLYRLVGAISVSAVVMAVIALLQGSEHEPWDLVGPFLNENTFSSYINLIFPVMLGVASAVSRRTGEAYRGIPSVLIYFCAGVLATSVLLSGSRAGAVITVGILLAWVCLEWRDRIQTGALHRNRRSWWTLVFPLVPVVGLLWLLGADILQSEFGALGGRVGAHLAIRFAVARDAWHIVLDYPLFGVGAGSFHAAYPYYQDAAIGGFYRHAHNDWVQWLAEVGITGCTLGLVAVVAAFRAGGANPHRPSLPSSINRGIVLGLLATAVHALIDFPFQIPAISILVAVWIGILAKRRKPVKITE